MDRVPGGASSKKLLPLSMGAGQNLTGKWREEYLSLSAPGAFMGDRFLKVDSIELGHVSASPLY